MAIIGMHALLYSKKADETRAFLRDVLGFHPVDTPVSEQHWGRVTRISLPSGGTLGLYQPKHPTAIGR